MVMVMEMHTAGVIMVLHLLGDVKTKILIFEMLFLRAWNLCHCFFYQNLTGRPNKLELKGCPNKLKILQGFSKNMVNK